MQCCQTAMSEVMGRRGKEFLLGSWSKLPLGFERFVEWLNGELLGVPVGSLKKKWMLDMSTFMVEQWLQRWVLAWVLTGGEGRKKEKVRREKTFPASPIC